MNETTKQPYELCALLHHDSVPQRDEQTIYFDYTAFILIGVLPRRVEFISYVPLSEEEIKRKAYDKFYE